MFTPWSIVKSKIESDRLRVSIEKIHQLAETANKIREGDDWWHPFIGFRFKLLTEPALHLFGHVGTDLKAGDTGEFAGVAPKGNELRVPAVSTFRIADGKLAEAWEIYDSGDMLRQMQA